MASVSLAFGGLLSLTTVAGADSDTSAPQLLGFSIDQGSIDTSAGSQNIVVTARITDNLAGVTPGMESQVRFKSPTGQLATGIFDQRVSGTPLDGVYETTLVVPHFAEQGTWTLEWVFLKDDIGNYVFIDGNDVGALPAVITFEQTGFGDATPPSLNSFILSPTSVDTSSASALIDITAEITDAVSGVSSASATFHSPSGNQSVNGSFFNTGGDTYAAQITVPAYAEQGGWILQSMVVVDNVGNQASLDQSAVGAVSATTTFDQAGVGDTTAPAVTAFALDVGAVDTSAAAATINVSSHLTDDVSGVDTTGANQARFRSPSGNQIVDVLFFAPEVGGDALSGDYLGQVALPQFAEQGLWHLEYFITRDAAGNQAVLLESDIAGIGGTTTFTNGTVSPGSVGGTVRRLGGSSSSWPADSIGVMACPGGAQPGDLSCLGAQVMPVAVDGTYSGSLDAGEYTLFPVTVGAGVNGVGSYFLAAEALVVEGGSSYPEIDFTVQATVLTGTVARPGGALWPAGSAGVFVCGFATFVLASGSPTKVCPTTGSNPVPVLSAPSDAAGNYAIVIPVGVYPISSVSQNAYASFEGVEVIGQQVTQFLSDTSVTRHFTLGAGRITGHVRDGLGNSLAGFYVFACQLPTSAGCLSLSGAITDSNGEYSKVVPMTSSSAQFFVTAGPYPSLGSNLALPSVTTTAFEGTTVTQDFVRSGAWVSGTVLDPNGNVAPNRQVQAKAPANIYSGGGVVTTTTDLLGRFRMFVLPGTYALVAGNFFLGDFAQGVRLGVTVPTAGELTDQDIALERGGTLAVSVTTPIAPAGGVASVLTVCRTDLTPDCVSLGTSNTDPAGNLILGSPFFPAGVLLPVGEWRIVATPLSRPELAQTTVDFTIAEGSNSVSIVLDDLGASISGKVRGTSGGTISTGGSVVSTGISTGGFSGSIFVVACPDGGHFTGGEICPGGIRVNAAVIDGAYFLGSLAEGTYNVRAGANVSGLGIVLSDERSIDVLAGEVLTDVNFVIGGSEDDGVSAAIEDGAPNGGDGNLDHFSDSQQANVASLPAAVSGAPYVTIESQPGTRLSGVSASAVPAIPPPPEGDYPVGVLNYSVVVPVGAQTTVKVYLPPGSSPTSVYKLQGGAWVNGSGYAAFGSSQVVLTLVDGGAGDADGVANGVIVDPLLILGGNALSVGDATVTEGGSGQQPATLRFSLAQPAVGTDVNFQVTLSNGTAVAPGDYAANTLTGTIPAGSTYVDVVVAHINGDTVVEDDETLTVTIDLIEGASVVDGTGTITITNDDVDDLDGIPDTVENGAPNGGDGNDDGFADSTQPNVTSLPSAIDIDGSNGLDDFLTVAAPAGTTLAEVQVLDPDDVGVVLPPGVDLPWGLLDFKLTGVTPGSTVTVEVYLPAGLIPNSYWKLVDSDHNGSLDSYVDYTGHADLSSNPVLLRIQDNGFGDDDPTPGVIHDPGLAGFKDVTGPTVLCPSPPTFLLNQAGASITATVTDSGSGPAAGSVTVSVPTGSVGPGAVSVTGSDLAGNVTTFSCAFSVTYAFTGFQAPVDNRPTVNSAKAGANVPVKWRITDANGVGVSNPASFVSITSNGTACTAATIDAIEQSPGNSGLQYLGNGYWQFSWTTPKSYAGQCRRMTLNLADGVTSRSADFKFK